MNWFCSVCIPLALECAYLFYNYKDHYNNNQDRNSSSPLSDRWPTLLLAFSSVLPGGPIVDGLFLPERPLHQRYFIRFLETLAFRLVKFHTLVPVGPLAPRFFSIYHLSLQSFVRELEVIQKVVRVLHLNQLFLQLRVALLCFQFSGSLDLCIVYIHVDRNVVIQAFSFSSYAFVWPLRFFRYS